MPAVTDSRYLVQAGWDDVPHLDGRTKAELLASTPPHLRDARSKGTPSLGSGAIYPIQWEEVCCDPMPIPAWWPRAFALDVGWNRTACLWGAWDRETDTIYAYSEYYGAQQPPAIHASAIKARGSWIAGVVDPASRGRAQKDGEQLIETYRAEGLRLTPADNTVEAGIFEVWQRLSTGRLKLFSTLGNLRAEYMLYRRDEHGRIVKKFDHLMDALRYLVMSGKAVAVVKSATETRTAQVVVADQTVGY
jgi:hypothetical protein